MKFYNICTKKTFTIQGVEKTKWLNVGTLKEMDDGKRFIELNILPNETLFVFEQDKVEPKTVEPKAPYYTNTAPSMPNQNYGHTVNNSMDNIPF